MQNFELVDELKDQNHRRCHWNDKLGLMSVVGGLALLILCGLTIVILVTFLVSFSRTVAELQETVNGLKLGQNQSVNDHQTTNEELRSQFLDMENSQANMSLQLQSEFTKTLKNLQTQLVDLENFQMNMSLELQSEFTSDVTGCGASWISYKHQKCVKILHRLFTHAEAEAECLKEFPTENFPGQNSKMIPLLTIDSSQEQQFLNRFIFIDSKILDNVWLGAQRQVKGNESIFIWKFGTGTGNRTRSAVDVDFHFKNWQESRPSSTVENRCVHMAPHGTRVSSGWSQDVDGLWQDAPCLRRNVVVCQKPQVFSLANLKSYFVEFKKETTRKIQSLEKSAGSVPLGFIYIQYRNQSAPSDLWPLLTWEDVTDLYSGEFFRALGNETGSFGEIQSENAPRLTRVTLKSGVSGESYIILPADGESGNVATVSRFHSGSSYSSMSFTTSAGEVRPKNSAVKIWKRI